MELKKGYKKAEAGIIPLDWDVKSLGEIASVSSGGTPDRQNPSYWDGNIPWITTTQIDFNSIDTANEFITRKGLENSAAQIYDSGTLLMAMYGQGKTRGKIAILGINATTNQACAAIKLGSDVYSQYIFFNLSARYNEIRSLSNIGNQENLNARIIKSILIPLPPLPEQRAIAAALSDVDALLTALDSLIAKKRLVKQGAMQELLTPPSATGQAGKRRLSGFSGEWETRKLGEITEIVSGGTPSTRIDEYWNGNINWCTPTDITRTSDKYLDSTEKRITELGLKNSSATLLPKGTLLLCSRATIGEIKIATDLICTNQGFKSLVCSNQVHNEFLYYVLLTMKPKLIEKAIGSTFLEITKKETALIEIRLPSISEQQAIAEILSDMDAEISALETRREKTRLLKEGMMQELLTGRIRLAPAQPS